MKRQEAQAPSSPPAKTLQRGGHSRQASNPEAITKHTQRKPVVPVLNLNKGLRQSGTGLPFSPTQSSLTQKEKSNQHGSHFGVSEVSKDDASDAKT